MKPSIGVGFKIFVGAPLFFPLDRQTKGGVVVGTTGGNANDSISSDPNSINNMDYALNLS